MKQGDITTLNNTADSKKASYQKPVLLALGDLRVLTQSGSGAFAEGGKGNSMKHP